MERLEFDCFSKKTKEKQIIEKKAPRKETKNSYLQLQGTETWSTIYKDADRTLSDIIIIVI